jgi:hypothetical protein
VSGAGNGPDTLDLDGPRLVSLDVERDDGDRVDHVGMYLDTDLSGARRSSPVVRHRMVPRSATQAIGT